jgi:hypothetical protein
MLKSNNRYPFNRRHKLMPMCVTVFCDGVSHMPVTSDKDGNAVGLCFDTTPCDRSCDRWFTCRKVNSD